MTTIAESLSASERTFAAGIAADRETQANKRAALVDRDGHLNFKGERCSPCTDCGLIFTESGLRLTRGASVRLLCRSCLAQAKTDRFQNDRQETSP